MDVKTKQGSVATIAIVVGVAILISVVGYVLLSKLKIVPTLGFSQSTKNTVKADTRPSASFDKSFGIDMSFRYPNAWKIDKQHEGTFPVTTNTTSVETYTLTSPDKKYTVVYRLGASPKPAASTVCDPKTAAMIIAADTEDVKGWQGVKFVRAITKTKAGKYLTTVGLVSNLAMYKLKVGQSACSFGPGVTEVPSMTLKLTLQDASVHGSSDMNILGTVPGQGVSSEKEARALYSGPSYDDAKAILLSTTLK